MEEVIRSGRSDLEWNVMRSGAWDVKTEPRRLESIRSMFARFVWADTSWSWWSCHPSCRVEELDSGSERERTSVRIRPPYKSTWGRV